MVKIPYFVIFSVEDAVVMLELLHCVLWMKWRSCTEISRDRNDILSFSGALWVISFCSCDWPVSDGVDGGIILGNIHISNTSWSDKLWIIRCFYLSIHLFFKCLTHPSHALWPASFISCHSPVGHCYERWEPYSIQQVLAQLTYSKFMTADEEQSLLHNNIQNSDSIAANTRFILKPGWAGLIGWFHSSSLDICSLIQPNSPSLSSYITIIKIISLSPV